MVGSVEAGSPQPPLFVSQIPDNLFSGNVIKVMQVLWTHTQVSIFFKKPWNIYF